MAKEKWKRKVLLSVCGTHSVPIAICKVIRNQIIVRKQYVREMRPIKTIYTLEYFINFQAFAAIHLLGEMKKYIEWEMTFFFIFHLSSHENRTRFIFAIE